MEFQIGQSFTYERTFTKEDVKDFIALSHYTGRHHEVENEDGEVMIQGLLTATLPTHLGGEYDLLVYRMEYNLLRPVYTKDRISCEITVADKKEKREKTHLDLTFVTTNQRGEEVLTGLLKAVVLHFEEDL